MATLSRLDILKTLRNSNLDVAFATSFGTLVGGTFLVGFVKKVHGGDLWIGLLSAIPSLLGVLQIIGGIWGRSFKNYKSFVWPWGLAWRLLYLPMAILPILVISNSWKLIVTAILLLLASTVIQFGSPVYNEWVAEIVPETSRGAYYSRRNAIATGVGSGVGILGGFLLDYFKNVHNEALGFAIIFGAGGACGLISFYFFMKMTDFERPVVIKQNVFEALRDTTLPFKNPKFRPVLIFIAASVFGQGVPGALFAAYAIEILKLPFTVILLCNAFQSIGIIFTASFWGFFADKYGNKPVLVLGGILIATNPVLWIIAKDGAITFDTVFLLFCHLYFGIGWGAIGLSQYNILLSTSPPEDRASYIGAGSAVTALVGGIAPLLGSLILTRFRLSMDAGSAYRVLFGISAGLRFLALFFMFAVREDGSSRVKTAFNQLRAATPDGVRALRTLQRSSDVDQREQALETLAEERLALASDAMVRALSDPVPRVRRTAATALSRLRDVDGQGLAAGALVEQIREHPELVEEEMVDALGVLGTEDAVQPLEILLKSPRSTVSRAAARALGRIGDSRAVPSLSVASRSPDPDLRRTAIQSLRRLNALEAGPAITDALSDDRMSVRTAAAEAIAATEFKGAAPKLRGALQASLDQVSHSQAEGLGSIIYALGAVGELEDLELLLKTGVRTETENDRQQSLLGIAKLTGVEGDVYRFMLLDGMTKDTQMQEFFRPLMRRSKLFNQAVREYTNGDEKSGLHILHQIYDTPKSLLFTEYFFPGLFLVAASIAVSGDL